MKKEQNYSLPAMVSDINPVYDSNKHLESWKLELSFNASAILPPRAKGGRIHAIQSGAKTVVEYRFPESVMKRGIENALRFQTEMLGKSLKKQNENTK